MFVEKPDLEVCLSPALLHLYNTQNTIVVIIDIFRATSTITTALHNGATSVIPIASVKDCIELGNTIPNSITAGERDGKIVEGLMMGNSPFEYSENVIQNKTLILTTTNGTRLLHMVQNPYQIVIGSFLNLSIVCNYLISQNKKVILGCASWKDKFNLEDTLFAGAVVNNLRSHFNINCDSARAARHLYLSTGGAHFLEFLKDSSHYKRLSGFGLLKDLEYCTTPDLHPVLPVLIGNEIKLLHYS